MYIGYAKNTSTDTNEKSLICQKTERVSTSRSDDKNWHVESNANDTRQNGITLQVITHSRMCFLTSSTVFVTLSFAQLTLAY